MNTLRTVSVIVFSLAVTAAFLGVFLGHPSRAQPGATIRWVVLYVVAIGHPIWWTALHYRLFRRLGIPMDRNAYALAWSPLWVGGTALLVALTLL